MADLANIQADLDEIKSAIALVSTGLDSIKTLVQQLKDQIAAGGVITQADLDALDVKTEEIKTALAAVQAQEDEVLA